MPYGRKARAVRAYKYGCLPPLLGEKDAIEVMIQRNALWNMLVELDRQYDVRREEILTPFIRANDGEERRKQRREALKREEVRAAMAALDREEYREARRLCINSHLYWCNYEEVMLDWQRARRRPGQLRFHRFTGEGKITVRWQKGLPVSKLMDSRFQLEPVPAGAYTGPRSQRRKLARSKALIRIRSENGRPVWLSIPCIIHRALPDGLLRSASVIRERNGSKWAWSLVLVVETEEERKCPQGRGTIALDIGWRKVPSGLRVAYWHDTQGNKGEVILSNEWLGGMEKVEDIQAIRDNRFNYVKQWFSEWLARNDVPAWLKEATETLKSWKRPARLSSIVWFWKDNRFNGDNRIYGKLEEWRRWDKHLWLYQANLRDKLIKRRREQYRVFASWVARTYAAVRLEEFNLARVARKRLGSKLTDLPLPARHQRFLAAPSLLRLAIENACQREGVKVEMVEAAYTTMICSYCGSVERFDMAAELIHNCSSCGKTWDQDDNAARNILSQMAALEQAEDYLRNSPPDIEGDVQKS